MIGLEIAYKNESNLQALSLHFHFHFTGFQMWHESSFQWLLTTDRAVALTQRCPRTSLLPDPFPRARTATGSADFAQPVRGVAQRLQRDTLPCIPEERSARGIRPWLNLRKRVYMGSREGGAPVPAPQLVFSPCSKTAVRGTRRTGSRYSCRGAPQPELDQDCTQVFRPQVAAFPGFSVTSLPTPGHGVRAYSPGVVLPLLSTPPGCGWA